MHLNLLEPILQRQERITIVDGIRHNNAHGPFVVGLGDCLEALLAGCVPDLHADALTVGFDCFYFEVDA